MADPSSREALILNWNKVAMEQLRTDQFETALSLLKKAEEELTKGEELPNRGRLEAILLNNLGLYYKRVKKPSVALHYLRRALEVESREPREVATLAGTHLNICAIRSGLGAHEKALEHAKKAIRLLVSTFDSSPNCQTTLIIAHHNAGIEYEFLLKFHEAAESYHQGYNLAIRALGTAHALTQNLKQAYLELLAEHKSERESRRSLASGRGDRGERTPRGGERRPASNGQRRTPVGKALPRLSTAPRKTRKKPEANQSSFPQRPAEISPGKNDSETRLSAGEDSGRLLGGNYRFIVGDRLKPMHKEGTVRDSSRPKTREVVPAPPSGRPGTKSVRTRTMETRHSSKKLDETVDTRIQSIDEKLQSLESALKRFETTSKATSSAIEVSLQSASLSQAAAAILIQKTVRGFIARKKYMRHQGQPQPSTLTKAQAIGPMRLTQKPKPPKEKKGLVFKRKALPSTLFPIEEKDKSEEDSAVLIQSVVRMFVRKRRFAAMKKAAVTIQSCIRTRQCRRLFLSIREAIIFIQSVYRGHLVRRSVS